ncbi:usherin [Trichomycterus rosablanca]|uniref:usherin n=1 Tax=Trichomycterus rosablanca TaxID=2290929 RepID=UPI002F358D83
MAVITYLTPRHQRASWLPGMHRLLGRILFLCTLGPVTSQGSFPRLENVAAYKAVSVDPGDATCGIPERSTFCQAAHSDADLHTCTKQFCIQECPYRSSTPRYTSMLDSNTCLTTEGEDSDTGIKDRRASFTFPKSGCSTSPAPILGPAGSFTVAVWLKPEEQSVMTVLEKSSTNGLVFLLTISRMTLQFHYSTQPGLNSSITLSTAGRFSRDDWTHVALQVHGTSVSLFLDGLEEDGTAFDTQTLVGPVADVTSDTWAWIGRSSDGSNQFVGRMRDFRFYSQTLTNREIAEVHTGHLPSLHTQTACRCPSTHPRVHPLLERYCIPNGHDDTTSSRVPRLHPHAHPLNYVNDDDLGTAWVSSVLFSPERLDRGVALTLDLENGEYQVFYVIVQFRNPQPEAVHIQRKTANSSAWEDWQYLARNCSYFGLDDNGPLSRPDSVNCLQFGSDIPYAHSNITFSMLTPEPNLRPSYNDFYNSAALKDFVRATHVRIHLRGQYHTRAPHVPARHRYYAVDDITITGRCECHGHASTCDTSVKPYRCACLPESHTVGHNCERCAPLFNDKPFRAGDQKQAYNCRPCQCHGHVASCHYDASVDPHPQEHFRGGGGVCDECAHNTAGRNCERCRKFFYRELGASLWAENACKPCECNLAGTVRGSQECDQTGGQCKCKRRVSGRECNQCQRGYYKLQEELADGCLTCNCHVAGTEWPHITCHQDSGQCQCKSNVIGPTCDRCDYGYKFLNRTNPSGCEPCSCHPHGSLHQFCNPLTGLCECRDGVQGLLCDTCPPGTYGPNLGGIICTPCDCSAQGTAPGSACHPVTGRCTCRPRTAGPRCDSCLDGWYWPGRDGVSLGCQPCLCETRGTISGSTSCQKETGQCRCKVGVDGPRCNHCSGRMYDLSWANSTHACRPCHCHPVGTLPGTECDPETGQCTCLTSYHARDCSTCKPGFFHSDTSSGQCEACDCHPAGALKQACAPDTGQCKCASSSLTGRRCDRCLDQYFGFNPVTGRCERCDCHPAGSLDGSCLAETGQCLCRASASGEKCDACVEGASHMDPDNHLGCSKDPLQQPPPKGTVLNATAVELSWKAPDSPNSNALVYTLLRDSEPVYTGYSRQPFGVMHFTDASLSPYTSYTYKLITSNVHGNTSSPTIALRTLSSVPDPTALQLNLVGLSSPTSASFNWTEPLNTSGPVERYTLSSVEEPSGEERLHYQGLATEVTVGGLHPFTRYNFSLEVCTNGGCASGAGVTVLTAQVPPQELAPPLVTPLSSTVMKVDWEPPAVPNGIIFRYELFMQELGNGTNPGPERRVFLSSGWPNPRRSAGSAKSGAMVSDLQPFTQYRFRVLAVNMAGSAASDWTVSRTAEGVPEYMSPPQVSPISSSSLLLSWATPREQDIRGAVTEYRVSLHQEQTSNPYAPPIVTQLFYKASPEERSYTVSGLKSYEEYSFTLSVCNARGCAVSLPASGRTLPSAPAGLKAPKLKPWNTTATEISWAAPDLPNGPPPTYHVERTDVSFSDAEGPVISGRRFTGTGYFHFPSTTLPINADFTGIKLSFRTRAEEGLILFAVSPGEQEEYVALQIHNGRPYFLFDPQASAVAVSPEHDGGRRYNDNQWHHLTATRKQSTGTIIVDDQYRGSASANSGGTIIGPNTGVFFGGLPEDFPVHRRDTGLARPVREGFAGCVRDVLIQTASIPADVWEPIDWDSALDRHETYEDWEGCPTHSEHGVYFLGHGFLKLKQETFSGGDDFEITFEFKTDQLNALLLFAHDVNGQDYILAELQGGILQWALRWGDQTVELGVWVGLSYCDGGWNSATVLKRGALTEAAINHASEQQRSARGGDLIISSPLYVGGVPTTLQHPALHRHSLLHGFGGCIRDVRLAVSGPVLNLAGASCGAVRVNLDGCLSADTSVNCRGNDSILVYAGSEIKSVDRALQPFTEYLYRVVAFGDGGWAAGPWQRGRSGETAPRSVLPPSRVASANGSSAEVSWEEPPGVRGVIESYVVKAYSRDRPLSPPVSAAFSNTQGLMGTLSGLVPFSSYRITLTACTRAGCTESLQATSLTTPQEAPEDVSPPRAVAQPDSLFVHWDPPERPNGIITRYILYKDDAAIYHTNQTSFNLTDLGVYTPHKLLLSACTEAGCTNSSAVTLFTGQLPPSHVDPPALTVLDAHSVYIRWTAPLEVNGQLEFYTLYQAVSGEEPSVVYNSSKMSEDHSLRNLVPGTTYQFQIAACTAGGCTLSTPSVAQTHESSPEDVPVPSILYVSPHELNVAWGPPLKPNGVISSYGLWMDGALMQNSSSTSFRTAGLSPWSQHTLRVQACTARGCALGPAMEVRTSEAPPVGAVPLTILPESPRSVRVKWEPPAKPNGNITYSLLLTGTFHQPAAQNVSEPEAMVTETRTTLSTGTAGRWVPVEGLLPFSNYSGTVRACNSKGCLESTATTVSLPPAAPDGLLPPRLAAATSTSLQVVWSSPERPNAPGPLRYQLQMRNLTTQHVQRLLDDESAALTHLVENLEPYTEYQFRVRVSHGYGESGSSWVSLRTAQDRPESVDPPVLVELHPRNATVSWSPPWRPNGILTHYNIYQDDQLIHSVPPDTSSLTLSDLSPYRQYYVRVEACTDPGCTLSADMCTFQTPVAPPQGVRAPRLYSDTPTSVLVTWEPPLFTNGPLEDYTLQRRVAGSQDISTVTRVTPDDTLALAYLDNSAFLSPWSSYEYRVVATTRHGGSNSSQWGKVTTRPSRPAGVQPPTVQALGPDSVQVTWSAPLVPNGDIERYEIRMPDPRVIHTDVSALNLTVTGLSPYTNYSVTILACSGGGGFVGGCTESLPSPVTTLPTIPQGLPGLSVVSISESFLAISWHPPSRPNGPNVRYELLRQKTQQPLSRRPHDDFHRWLRVYAGHKLFHEDKGLSRFTRYEYKLLVHNDMGYTVGDAVPGVTLAGPPLSAPNVSALTLNHMAILLNWTTPTVQDLQGEVDQYYITVSSQQQSQTLSLEPSATSALLSDLQPNTEYTFTLTVSNGAHNITSPEVTGTTADGEPEGVFPPDVVTLNSTSVRVLWAPPLVPNGAISNYSVYLDGELHTSTDGTSGSLELHGLLPLTVYEVQVEVCTAYACARGNSTKFTTVEDTPGDVAAPYILVLSSRSVKLEWTSPGQPNGIMGGYNVHRRTLKPCEELQAETPQTRCSYLRCPVDQDFCGRSCFQPQQQVCCEGTVHTIRASHRCCGELYVPVRNASASVCCGEKFYTPLPQYQCCAGYYIQVPQGQICCPDPDQPRASVGPGDSCCGASPFSSTSGQICCDGLLHDGYRSRCCGGQPVHRESVCCGDAHRGTVHASAPGMACCGDQYINTSAVVCCGNPERGYKAHLMDNSTASLKCCWTELIEQEKECCGGMGFEPDLAVCADQAPHGLIIPEKCHPRTLCPVSLASTAYCGTCDLDPTRFKCSWVPDQPGAPSTAESETAPGRLCPSPEELVFSGAPDRRSFTDSELEPYTTYEYRLAAWNSGGQGFSSPSWISTKEDVPEGVPRPKWSRVGARNDIIQLDWSPPFKANGKISHYVLTRDGQERYRGTERSFTDAGGIRPFQEYTYQLRACTAAGCADSPKVVAATVQGVPEEVPAPAVRPLRPDALHISWEAPTKPNGVVREYQIVQGGVGLVHTHTSGDMEHVIKGLEPYTNYSFVLVACTAAGCGASKPSMGRTLQDAPADVWSMPRHVLVNGTAVELHWSRPSKPNGLLTHYRLLRDGESVYTAGPDESCYTDTGLQPNIRYTYELEAGTDGGSGTSSPYIIQTSAASPEKIPPPHNVSVLGPRSVFVAWSLPDVYNESLPLEYNVLLNAGTERPLTRPAGPHRFLLLDGLDPYTTYSIRVQACQADGCGVGQGVTTLTSEAAPKAQDPPELHVAGSAVVEVSWNPPRKPNGLITAYFIHRRPKGTLDELLVFIWSEGPLEFTDASDFLKPFTEYEYRVTARNSQGSTSSSWRSVLTPEAEPQGMDAPTTWATGAYSILVNWTQPGEPNGLISEYKVVYKKRPSDPTLDTSSVIAVTVPGDVYQTHVFGLEPYTTYSVRVEAVNGAGSASSPWATVHTEQAFPGGLANFTVEKREHGRALLLHWSEPTSPNGVIKTYNIYSDENLEYSGLSRQFLFRRLNPFTTYSLVLEACTTVGCTRTAPQDITTDEASPSSQLPPSAHNVTSNSVELHWAPPGQPNGRILEYQVIAVNLESSIEELVFTQTDVQAGSFLCVVSGLKPWTRYEFRLRVSNAAGSIDSHWLIVQTKQAPPSRLAAPTVTHLDGRPSELLLTWEPPLDANGVLLSYRIQRNGIALYFSFDPSVLNYTDENLTAYTDYSYAVIACTVAGCATSYTTSVRTLEAAPEMLEPPEVSNVTSYSLKASWDLPLVQNGKIIQYILKINKDKVYQGDNLAAQVTGLQPHTAYHLVLTACTKGGCTASQPTSVLTKEAAPTDMTAPTLKVTGPESVEVTWREPDHPNGVITEYELQRDGHFIYTGMDTRYHDFTLLPSIEYAYRVTAKNSQGAATSPVAVAHTQPSAPSGLGPPLLQVLGASSIMVQWEPPARANGVIISYSLYARESTEPNAKRTIFAPHHSAFQSRTFSITDLKPYHRYEVRVEACTLLGCAASDWSSVRTPEAFPADQRAPTLEPQADSHGMLNGFLISWSPPAEANGRLLHYELYRRLGGDTGGRGASLLSRNVSTFCHDRELLPYTVYEYQVWAVNSAGRTGSPWAVGRTGPAPPEGVNPPTFSHIRATSAVVDIGPPTRPNGIVTIYRVFAEKNGTRLLLSEGTSRQQTLHDLAPFTIYSVGVEACTCFLCCTRGPVSELRTQASAPSQQPPPRPVTVACRSALLEWDEPLQPNGVIESCELLVRRACPQPLQPVPVECSVGPVETRFFGKERSFNVTALLPYTNYEVCVVSYNNMGSTTSDWFLVTTLKEAPQYKEPFVVQSNLTMVYVDWTESFSLNGRLRDYALTESGLRLYSGFHSSIYIPRTSDKTFAFQVTCTTDGGSASSPVIKYNTATGVDAGEQTSGGKTGVYFTGYRFYTELWFIVLMALVGLLLVALVLGLVLRRALRKPAFIRERAPLQALQKRNSSYPPNDSYLRSCSELCSNHTALLQSDQGLGFTDSKIGITNQAYRSSISTLHVPNQSELGHAYSQNSLHRSVSQLIDTQDKKSLAGLTWNTELKRADSGMYVGDEELEETIKCISSVKKEQATFTDTHL